MGGALSLNTAMHTFQKAAQHADEIKILQNYFTSEAIVLAADGIGPWL